MGTPNKFAQTLRDTVIPMVSRLAPFQHAFVQRLSELGIAAYSGSPIIEGSGKRYLDESMRGGNGISSRFLIMIDDDHNSTAEAARQLCGSFSDIVELRQSRNHSGTTPGIKLVRPDG
jgi:hypothetical protein